MGFKAFWSAAIAIAGIEIMHMIRKDQLRSTGKLPLRDTNAPADLLAGLLGIFAMGVRR